MSADTHGVSGAQSGTFQSVADLLGSPPKRGMPGLVSHEDVKIKDLGRCPLPSPIARHLGDTAMHFVGEADKVLVDDFVFAR